MRMLRIRMSPLVVLGTLAAAASLAGQTVITPPKNKYTPAQDVELGRKAAQEVEQQLPLLRDDAIVSPIASLGERLAAAIPAQLQHAEFRYTFEVVNVKEINAFALPGGPMFLNRGMIEAAKSEGEVAGVMAHEMSHVALRHGTAQATKATKYEIGQLLGAVVGSVIGGTVGSAVAQGTQFGLGTAFLRFSRADEKQADLLGSHIMADAGYDPREMASMFKTIEQQGGSGGPQWMSDHPNPGNRADYITREAALLVVRNPVRDTRGFADVQARLHRLPPAPTTEEATRNAKAGGGTPAPSTRPTADYGAIAAPSSRYTTYTEGNIFKVSVPSNWKEYGAGSSVTFAPDGAYGTVSGQTDFTHGMQLGISRNETHDLATSTEELIQGMAQANPNVTRPNPYQRTSIGGRQGLYTVLANLSGSTGRQERIAVYTTQLGDGSLFYAFGVAGSDRFAAYTDTFRRIVSSIRFMK